ncbi:MAG: response regulator [Bacteriovoracales bacterium]|nr:response regulator [Bacteriovoracales bacterium]
MLEEFIEKFAKEKSLTKRETEILFLLTKNITHLKEIAAYLKLSRSTINNHLNNIYIKVNVKGKAQLLSRCFGYISEHLPSAKEMLPTPRVLLVDDKEDPRLILRDHLEDMGFSVIATTSLSQARRLLENEEIDLILSEISMPEFDGFQLLKEVRIKNPKYPVFLYDRTYKMSK